MLLSASMWLWWSLARDLLAALWSHGGWQRILAGWVALPTALSFIAAGVSALALTVVALRGASRAGLAA